jgi:hypothetical protein
MTYQVFVIKDWKDSGISDEVISANQGLIEQSALLLLKKWFTEFVESFPTHSVVPDILRGCRYSRGRTAISFPDGEKRESLVLRISVCSPEQMEKILLVRHQIIARLEEIDKIEIIIICCEPVENGKIIRATKCFAILLPAGLEYHVSFDSKKRTE